jgi:hypothetical protein
LFSGAWFILKGTNVTFRGVTDERWGWIDAHGQQWWDAVNQINRPHGFKFTVTNFVLKDMKLWKPVGWCFSLGGSNVQALNNRIEAGSSTSVSVSSGSKSASYETGLGFPFQHVNMRFVICIVQYSRVVPVFAVMVSRLWQTHTFHSRPLSRLRRLWCQRLSPG